MTYSTLRPYRNGPEVDNELLDIATRVHEVCCCNGECHIGMTWGWYEDVKFMLETGATEEEIIYYFNRSAA